MEVSPWVARNKKPVPEFTVFVVVEQPSRMNNRLTISKAANRCLIRWLLRKMIEFLVLPSMTFLTQGYSTYFVYQDCMRRANLETGWNRTNAGELPLTFRNCLIAIGKDRL
jgi:hypothetical protein